MFFVFYVSRSVRARSAFRSRFPPAHVSTRSKMAASFDDMPAKDHTWMEGGLRRIHGDVNAPPPVKCMCGKTVVVVRLKAHLCTNGHFQAHLSAFRARHSTPENDGLFFVERDALRQQMNLADERRRKDRAAKKSAKKF